MIQVGRMAPAFSLPDSNGANVTLSSLRGNWVVLYFYPKDDTPGCTTEACEFSEHFDEFVTCGAEVIGISPDSSGSHRTFIGKHQLLVRLLSDSGHKVAEAYGAWGVKSMYGREFESVIRSTVLINPAGKVVQHWQSVNAKGHAAEVMAVLREKVSAMSIRKRVTPARKVPSRVRTKKQG